MKFEIIRYAFMTVLHGGYGRIGYGAPTALNFFAAAGKTTTQPPAPSPSAFVT